MQLSNSQLEPGPATSKILNMTEVVQISTEAVKTNRPQATELRMNDEYVFYYVNLARFIVTLVVPFISLVYLNTNIYL